MELLQIILTIASVTLAAVYMIRQTLTRRGCTGCPGRCSPINDLVPLSAMENLSAIENSAESASLHAPPHTRAFPARP